MTSGGFRFERFLLDPRNRRLSRDDDPVELNARYLDALVLLVREDGRLVSKDRFLEEVWRGVPVTDEALTQCVRTLRRQLGDDAANPRFIETVPKHGYRFIADVERIEETDPGFTTADPAPKSAPAFAGKDFVALGSAGMLGGGAAGLVGGIFYGFAAASQPVQSGIGALSVLLVLVCVTVSIGLAGGAGVGFGVAAAGFARERRWLWSILGGAGGGMLVGAVVKLLALDAFHLLFGHSPGEITGATEGALLGGAVGFGAWLGSRGPGRTGLRSGVAAAAVTGAAAGVAIALRGGRLMGGSLDSLARQFPLSRLRLDEIGALFGESGFGPVAQTVTGALEGLLFGGCVVGATILARRRAAGRGAGGGTAARARR